MRIKKLLEFLFQSHFNLYKTLLLNFKVFEFKTAIKLPVFCYGKVIVVNANKGCIKFICPIKRGLLRVGGGKTYMTGYENFGPSYLNIRGVLIVGKFNVLLNGVQLAIADNAKVMIGSSCTINTRVRIYSENYIEIGDSVFFGWESQIIDTDFHYLVKNGLISKKEGSVVIGNNCWIGNRVTIQKGTFLPPYSTVASNSMVNKDYSSNPEGCVYGGIPAKKILENTKPICGVDKEFLIQGMFNEGKELVLEDDYESRYLSFDGDRNQTLWGL